MYKNLQFLPLTVVSSTLSLSYSSCAFMSSPTRLHPTGTEEAAEIHTAASRTREEQTCCCSCSCCFGSLLVTDQQWKKQKVWGVKLFPRGLRSGLAQLWGRIGRGREEGCGTDKVGGEDESPSPTPIYSELLSAHFSVLRSDPKLPLSLTARSCALFLANVLKWTLVLEHDFVK